MYLVTIHGFGKIYEVRVTAHRTLVTVVVTSFQEAAELALRLQDPWFMLATWNR